MKKEERKNRIIQLVSSNSDETIENLAVELNVSEMTIRRDLLELEKENLIIKTRNSILLKSSFIYEIPFATKQFSHTEEKKEIAEKAVKLIRPNEVVLLDSGTTTFEIGRLLKYVDYTVTVMTNDIKIAAEMVDSNHRVMIFGGEVQKDTGSIYGVHTMDLLEKVKVNVSFVGAAALSIEDGVFSPTFEKAKIKSLMIKASDRSWLVTDSSKVNSSSFVKVCDFGELDGIITDNRIAEVDKIKLDSITRLI